MKRMLVFGIASLLVIAIAAWAAEAPKVMEARRLADQARTHRVYEKDQNKVPVADGPQDRTEQWTTRQGADRAGRSIIQDDYTLRAGAGVCSPIEPGIRICETAYEYQHNDAAPHMIATQGSGHPVHFTWMYRDVIPESIDDPARFVNFNSYNSAIGMMVHGNCGITISGAGGDPGDARAGFTTLDVDDQNRAQVAFHQRDAPQQPDGDYSSWLSGQLHEAFGVFTEIELSGSEGILGIPEDDMIWPHVTADQVPAGSDVIHVVAHTYRSNENIVYWRYKSPSWQGPYLIDANSSLSYNIAADRNSNKCALITENNMVTPSNPNGLNQIVYRESLVNGDDWGPVNTTGLGDAKRSFITNYQGPTDSCAWLEVVGDYDNSSNLHVVWVQQRFCGIGDQAGLRHWDKASNVISGIHTGYWDNAGMCGARDLNLAYPTLGFGDGSTICGAGTNSNYLYVTFVQFGGWSAAEQNDMSAKGYMNGEVCLSVSNNNGSQWSPPVNLTNSKTPGCDPELCDSCASENFPSIARTIDDTIHIMYIADRDAGDMPFGQGGWTFNPVMYNRIPGGTNVHPVCPTISPNFAAVLSDFNGPNCENHTLPNTIVYETLTVSNFGNAALSGTISKQYLNPPAGTWLNMTTGSFSITPGNPSIQYSVTMNAAGLAEGLYRAQISISHNDPSKPSPFVIPVDLFVFSTFICPQYVVLHTKWVEFATWNTGRVGSGPDHPSVVIGTDGPRPSPQDRPFGLSRPPYSLSGTPPGPDSGNNSIYDGSLIIARPPTDVSNPPDGIPDTVVYRYLYGQGNFAKGFRALSNLQVDTNGYGTNTGNGHATADLTTIDSILGVTVRYEFPQDDDSSNLVLVKYRVSNRTASPLTGLTIGEAVDFDILPATQYAKRQYGAENTAGFLMGMNLIYQRGVDSAGVSLNQAEKYYGGMTAIQCTVAPRAWNASNKKFLFNRLGGGFSEGYLYQQLQNSGFEILPRDGDSVPRNGADLHSVITFAKNVTLDPAAVKHYVLGFVTSTAGPDTADLMATTRKAWRYAFGWDEFVASDTLPVNTPQTYPYYGIGSHASGPVGGCCGCVITETSDPSGKFSFTPDTDPCAGTINFAGSSTGGVFSATFRLATPACDGPLYTEDRTVTVLVTGGITDTLCFNAAVSYPVNVSPRSVFAADLDGDGDQDLAAANQGSNNVSVLKNNGNGTYSAAVDYATGSSPFSVFAADLDSDGDRDLAVSNTSGNDVSVLKNNGNGTFGAAINYAAGTAPISIFAADIDGDGDQDLAAANTNSNNVSVLKNNGNGTFAVAVSYTVGTNPNSVFLADLDGDGDRDLTVANRSSNNVSVLKNNGNGTFAAAINYGAGNSPFAVFVADLDGDGDRDLVAANFNSNNVSVLNNLGGGTFGGASNYGAGSGPVSVVAADLDGDGDQDLAVANVTSNNVWVLYSVGPGSYAVGISHMAGNGPYSVVAADLDGDGDQDLAVANRYSENVSVLINCGAVCDCPHQGDINGDGNIDVFDVINLIGIAFSGDPDVLDPLCPTTRGDVNNDGVTDVFDVIAIIGTAFSGGSVCDPCTPGVPAGCP